jgi:hypothetical protein
MTTFLSGRIVNRFVDRAIDAAGCTTGILATAIIIIPIINTVTTSVNWCAKRFYHSGKTYFTTKYALTEDETGDIDEMDENEIEYSSQLNISRSTQTCIVNREQELFNDSPELENSNNLMYVQENNDTI